MTGVQVVDEWPDEPEERRESGRLCRVCGEYLSTHFFARVGSFRDDTTCAPCWREKQGRAMNDPTIKWNDSRFSSARHRNRAYILEYLNEHPCKDCGEPDPAVLEFDHLPGSGKKKAAISEMVYRGATMQQLLDEIEKCEVVCANCHKRRTDSRRPKRNL